MRALVIGGAKLVEITEAVVRARERTISLTESLELAKRVKDQGSFNVKLEDRPETFRPKSQFVEIPHGFLAAISFESQPSGLCRHLSVSIDRPGKLPSPAAVEYIAKAFGFPRFPPDPGRIWLEEFEPGHQAVNVVQLEPS